MPEKSYQNLSNYIQFLLKKRFELNEKKSIILAKKCEIQGILSMIMFTLSSQRIFNQIHYTGIYLWVMAHAGVSSMERAC